MDRLALQEFEVMCERERSEFLDCGITMKGWWTPQRLWDLDFIFPMGILSKLLLSWLKPTVLNRTFIFAPFSTLKMKWSGSATMDSHLILGFIWSLWSPTTRAIRDWGWLFLVGKRSPMLRCQQRLKLEAVMWTPLWPQRMPELLDTTKLWWWTTIKILLRPALQIFSSYIEGKFSLLP